MTKLMAILALISLTGFANDSRQDLPGVPAEVLRKMASKLGVQIDDPGAPVRAAALAAPGRRSKLESPVQHDTYCVTPSGGFGSSVNLMKVGSYDGEGAWQVSLEKIDGSDPEKVEDAVVTVTKDIRFNRVVQSHWGMVQTRTETKTFIAQLHVSSKSTVLGHILQGCIPQETKEIDLQVTCYDSMTLPLKR